MARELERELSLDGYSAVNLYEDDSVIAFEEDERDGLAWAVESDGSCLVSGVRFPRTWGAALRRRSYGRPRESNLSSSSLNLRSYRAGA